MQVGDLVALKYSPRLTLGVIMALDNRGGEWASVLFIGEKEHGWWQTSSLKSWSENESR